MWGWKERLRPCLGTARGRDDCGKWVTKVRHVNGCELDYCSVCLLCVVLAWNRGCLMRLTVCESSFLDAAGSAFGSEDLG